MIRFQLDERKAAQAGAFLIGQNGGQIAFFRLLKLLYLADRRALLETGSPITGDRAVSMNKGPVLSNIYNIIKGEKPSAYWSQLITRPQGNHVLCLQTSRPPVDELSLYELDVLQAVFHQFGRMRYLVEYLHGLGEWKDPSGSSIPIYPEEILRAENRSAEDIRRIEEDAEELWQLDSVIRADG